MTDCQYHGYRDKHGTAIVVIVGPGARVRALPPRLDIANHSPTGLEWGYGGSGPAQLALALLAHALENDLRALRLHQKFKWQVVAALSKESEWWMTADAVRFVAEDIERHRQNA